jgi:murein DD-endopeptidase MepM/ murein hydrolase activator NlpD
MLERFRNYLLQRIKFNALSPESYQPYFGLELSRLTIFSAIFLFCILLSLIVYFLLGFTFFSAFLPERVRSTDKELFIEQQIRIDSLSKQIELSQQYTEDLKNVLLGKKSRLDAVPDSIPKVESAENLIDPESSEVEQELMNKIQDDLNKVSAIAQKDVAQNGLFFFAPVRGTMSQKMTDDHPAVDVVTRANEPVKSVLDGRIIYAEFSQASGYTVIVFHNRQFISVYKHLQALTKKAGERVKVGDVIGIVGNTGENSTGPHLHFELIFEGRHVNPTDFVSFK